MLGKTLACLLLAVLVVGDGANAKASGRQARDVYIGVPAPTPAAPNTKQNSPLGGTFSGKTLAQQTPVDYSKLSTAELLNQAKAHSQKSHDTIEKGGGITLMKEIADRNNMSIEGTCAKLMGETLKSITEQAVKNAEISGKIQKEMEARLKVAKELKKN